MEDIDAIRAFYAEMTHADLREHGKAWHAEREQRMQELLAIGQPDEPAAEDAAARKRGRPIGSGKRDAFPPAVPMGALDNARLNE